MCRMARVFFILMLALAVVAAGNEPATVDINFDQVEIRNCVKLIGELTGRRFVVDESIKGKVTVLAPRVAPADVYPLFIKILESVGCAAVEEGGVVRVIPFTGRANANAPILTAGEKPPQWAGLVTRIIRLRYATAGDLRRVLEAMSGRERSGTVASIDTSNHLVITDTPSNVERIERMVTELDQPGAAMAFEVVVLTNLDAREFAEEIMPVLTRAERQREGGLAPPPDRPVARNLSVVAAPNVNSLLLIGNAAEVAELKKTIIQIDDSQLAGQGNLHVIFLKYLAADEAAKSLKALIGQQVQQDRGKGQPPAQQQGQVAVAGGARRIAIEANMANNALLIDAGPRDYDMIGKMVAELDQMTDQVLIEVVIAEMSLSDALDLGVDFYSMTTPSAAGKTTVIGASQMGSSADSVMSSIQNNVFPKGITIGVARGTSSSSYNLPAVFSITALQKNNKFKILSSVPLLTQNNREASVSVVNNIPMLKSTVSGGTGSARDIIQNIERYDVGIKLKLTPHVNPEGQVKMVLNPSIEAVIDPGTSGQYTPTIAKREVSTTVTVPDGQTIVISGLIREDRTEVVRKVPLLGDIPLIRFLFRSKTTSAQRTNLLVFVTPHLIKTMTAAQALTKEYQARAGLSATNMP